MWNGTHQRNAKGYLVGKMHMWNGDFRISMNEMTVKVGEAEERLNILDFPWYGPILNNLDFVWGHCEAFRGQHVSEVFTGSDMELTFFCMGKNSVSTESTEYFQDMGFRLGNVVRINEVVIQIYDDYNIDHIHKDVHESLKSCQCVSKPFRHWQPLE